MTHEDILQRIKEHQMCGLTWKQFHELFPSHCLTKDEMDFKMALAETTGNPPYNPTGSSQHDKVMKFIFENHLSYRILDNRPVFYRGRIDFSEYEKRQSEQND